MKAEERRNLRIEKLVYRGDGLGHDAGKAVFIPRTVPGDIVTWVPVREKKSYIQGRLVDVTVPSPERVVAVCPEYGRCGGCQWQHVDYGAQLRWKREIVAEILGRAIGLPGDRVNQVLSSPVPFHYRSRTRLTWKQGKLGFRRAGSHRMVPVEQCPLLVSRLDELLKIVDGNLLKTSCFSGTEGELLLEMGDKGNPRAIFKFHTVPKREAHRVKEMLKKEGALAESHGFSLWAEIPGDPSPFLIAGEDSFFLFPSEGTSVKLAVPPGGFFQANLFQNRTLTAFVLTAAGKVVPPGPISVLDLYCGMGNLSIPMAAGGWRVVGVDNAISSVETARKNAAVNGLESVRFVHADAGSYLEDRVVAEGAPYDLVVLDPPRTGARKVAEILAKSERGPGAVVYVSCDPMTLGRDLRILAEAAYNVESVTPIDMFPQTFHIETVTVLTKG